MLQSHQFLMILDAESRNLVTVTISLPEEGKERIVGEIMEAFQTDGFSDTSRAWNDERRLIVEEALETHFVPMGTKWAREYLRDECEERLLKRLYDAVMSVSILFYLAIPC